MLRNHLVLYLLLILSCSGKPASDDVSTAGASDQKEVVCFIYHRFDDSRYPSTNTPVKDFEDHLLYLTKNNYQLLTFSEAIAYLQSDKPTKKTAVITIDDAFKSFYEKGLPLLKKYHVPATLFINTKTVGGGDYMSWAQLKDATDHNVEIGNHTHSHDFFLDQPAATRYKTFKEEIELSQSLIEENMGITPTVFSYPYGEFDNEMKGIVKAAGFKAAAAQNSGVMYSGGDLFQCPRFPMSEAYSAKAKFIEKATMKAFSLTQITPDDCMLPASNPPTLTLSFDAAGIRLNQLQCFVQGGKCSFKITDKNKVTVTLQATAPLSKKRRTLYTLTAPDKNGAWHWYSHLWINPHIKGTNY
ncbi:MAG TPA: polysaccharide deacetylase family protein [Ohtaekwangia sp.]|uniref:polysaccharide deacetylase family protein n=2 Tax=Ohtaekwangia sp. TaxID=2066019 RepID=UPI002F93C4C7